VACDRGEEAHRGKGGKKKAGRGHAWQVPFSEVYHVKRDFNFKCPNALVKCNSWGSLTLPSDPDLDLEEAEGFPTQWRGMHARVPPTRGASKAEGFGGRGRIATWKPKMKDIWLGGGGSGGGGLWWNEVFGFKVGPLNSLGVQEGKVTSACNAQSATCQQIYAMKSEKV